MSEFQAPPLDDRDNFEKSYQRKFSVAISSKVKGEREGEGERVSSLF